MTNSSILLGKWFISLPVGVASEKPVGLCICGQRKEQNHKSLPFIVARIYVVVQTIALILAKIKITGTANNFIIAFTTSSVVKQVLKVK